MILLSLRRRNNSNVLREELIQDLASDIKMRNALHRADMKQAEVTVIVEVIRNICCMAVVPKYNYYRKYNLLEVAKINAGGTQKDPEQTLPTKLEDKSVAVDDSNAQISEPLTDLTPDKGIYNGDVGNNSSVEVTSINESSNIDSVLPGESLKCSVSS